MVIGARADGTKELVALEDGYRESAESWAEQRRGLEAPVVAVGDGAPPCWLLAPSTRTIRASASGLSVSAD